MRYLLIALILTGCACPETPLPNGIKIMHNSNHRSYSVCAYDKLQFGYYYLDRIYWGDNIQYKWRKEENLLEFNDKCNAKKLYFDYLQWIKDNEDTVNCCNVYWFKDEKIQRQVEAAQKLIK